MGSVGAPVISFKGFLPRQAVSFTPLIDIEKGCVAAALARAIGNLADQLNETKGLLQNMLQRLAV